VDVLGRSNKLACDSNSVAIKCKTDNTSYQALDMAVSCKCQSHRKRKNNQKVRKKIVYQSCILLIHPNKSGTKLPLLHPPDSSKQIVLCIVNGFLHRKGKHFINTCYGKNLHKVLIDENTSYHLWLIPKVPVSSLQEPVEDQPVLNLLRMKSSYASINISNLFIMKNYLSLLTLTMLSCTFSFCSCNCRTFLTSHYNDTSSKSR